MMRLRTSATMFLLASLLVACGVQGSGLFVSSAREAELGAEVHQQVLQEYSQLNDSSIQSWIDQLGNTLARQSEDERTGVTYRFHVLDSNIVNAFAAPGGYVYLTCGLILASETEAEVAGVLAHEIGHVARRHGVAKLERAAVSGVIGDLFFGDGTFGDDAIMFMSGFVLNTEYSQDQETDADLMAVQFTTDAGINPYGLVDFFDRLSELGGNLELLDWLSSHPNPRDRAAASDIEIQRVVPGLSRNDSRYTWDPTGDFADVQNQAAIVCSGTD